MSFIIILIIFALPGGQNKVVLPGGQDKVVLPGGQDEVVLPGGQDKVEDVEWRQHNHHEQHRVYRDVPVKIPKQQLYIKYIAMYP